MRIELDHWQPTLYPPAIGGSSVTTSPLRSVSRRSCVGGDGGVVDDDQQAAVELARRA